MGHDVIDHDHLVREMLEDQVPLRPDAEADWANALQRASALDKGLGTQARPSRGERIASRIRGRRFVVPALAALVLLLAGVATAAGVRHWSGPSKLSSIDTKGATNLVGYTLTSDFSIWKKGDRVAVWRFPQNEGTCVFMALASPKPSAPGATGQNPGSGGFCNASGSILMPGKPIAVMANSSLQSGRYNWLIYGAVSPDSGVTNLALRSANGSAPLAYNNGWFIGELPTSSSSDALAPGGPYVIVGSDSHGTAVAQLDLQKTLPGLAK
jgi:hypothetical protein